MLFNIGHDHSRQRRHIFRFAGHAQIFVDLVAIVTSASVEAGLQKVALRSEAERRGVTLPPRFDVPDRELWERGYEAEAGRSIMPTRSTLDEALAVVRPFIDSLLDGTAEGAWDPKAGGWTDGGPSDG